MLTSEVVGGSGFIVSSLLLMLEVQRKWWLPALTDLGWWSEFCGYRRARKAVRLTLGQSVSGTWSVLSASRCAARWGMRRTRRSVQNTSRV